MTQYLETLNVGDTIKISGPAVLFYYGGNGSLKLIFNVANIKVKKLGLICGGAGITVFYPLIRSILENPEDKTQVTLLFANNTEEDIQFKAELDEACKDPRIKVHYTLVTAPDGWKGHTGFVNKKMIQEMMPQAGPETFMWVCGPPEMEGAVAGQLNELKYPRHRRVIASWWSSFIRITIRSILFCSYS